MVNWHTCIKFRSKISGWHNTKFNLSNQLAFESSFLKCQDNHRHIIGSLQAYDIYRETFEKMYANLFTGYVIDSDAGLICQVHGEFGCYQTI